MFFYYYLILENNFNLKIIFKYLGISILILIFQNIIKNINIGTDVLIILNLSNVIFLLGLIILKKVKYI